MNDISARETKDYRSKYWSKNKCEWKQSKVIKIEGQSESLSQLQTKQMIEWL
jgi:hypothetical protein